MILRTISVESILFRHIVRKKYLRE